MKSFMVIYNLIINWTINCPLLKYYNVTLQTEQTTKLFFQIKCTYFLGSQFGVTVLN